MAASPQRQAALQQHKRMAQYRYQQSYDQRLREQQMRYQNERYDYNNDPYFYSAPIYRYSYGGHWYETNQYGADMFRQALNYGYQEGFQAGRADRRDHWRFDYRNSYAYQDGNFGYNGYYARQDDYNYYFRQGFRRGYEDGYYSRYRYGRYYGGSYSLRADEMHSIFRIEVIGHY
jgi:hypothetical protein